MNNRSNSTQIKLIIMFLTLSFLGTRSVFGLGWQEVKEIIDLNNANNGLKHNDIIYIQAASSGGLSIRTEVSAGNGGRVTSEQLPNSLQTLSNISSIKDLLSDPNNSRYLFRVLSLPNNPTIFGLQSIASESNYPGWYRVDNNSSPVTLAQASKNPRAVPYGLLLSFDPGIGKLTCSSPNFSAWEQWVIQHNPNYLHSPFFEIINNSAYYLWCPMGSWDIPFPGGSPQFGCYKRALISDDKANRLWFNIYKLISQ